MAPKKHGKRTSQEEKPKFRWLQVSDLHIPHDNDDFMKCKRFVQYALKGNERSYDQYEKMGISGIIKVHGGVDCIILTGDCFHKGRVTNNSKKNVSHIIRAIYGACFDTNGNEWPEESPMERLCYCPGNHDMLRCVNKLDSNTGDYIFRGPVVQEIAESCDAYLCVDDKLKKNLVVDDAFQIFNDQMLSLTKEGDITSNKPYPICGRQITCFYPQARDQNFKQNVVVVGLNTALLAGQVEKASDGDGYEAEAYNEIKNKVEATEYREAQSHLKKIIDRHMIQNGTKISDEGKMCLPEERAFTALEEKLKAEGVIPILFGHHGIEFFNDKAKAEMNSFLRRYKIPVYLCGHAHQIHDIRIGGTTFSRFNDPRCLEVTAGGLFWDNSGYNQIGFSIGTIELNRDGSYTITVEHYTCVQFGSGNETTPEDAGIWMRGVSQNTYDKPTVTGGVEAPQDIPQTGECVSGNAENREERIPEEEKNKEIETEKTRHEKQNYENEHLPESEIKGRLPTDWFREK